jgi:hypothetical protein
MVAWVEMLELLLVHKIEEAVVEDQAVLLQVVAVLLV